MTALPLSFPLYCTVGQASASVTELGGAGSQAHLIHLRGGVVWGLYREASCLVLTLCLSSEGTSCALGATWPVFGPFVLFAFYIFDTTPIQHTTLMHTLQTPLMTDLLTPHNHLCCLIALFHLS